MLILRSENGQIDGERKFLLSRNSFISQSPLKKGCGAAPQLAVPNTCKHIYLHLNFYR